MKFRNEKKFWYGIPAHFENWTHTNNVPSAGGTRENYEKLQSE
jgi:hypothetical protein